MNSRSVPHGSEDLSLDEFYYSLCICKYYFKDYKYIFSLISQPAHEQILLSSNR